MPRDLVGALKWSGTGMIVGAVLWALLAGVVYPVLYGNALSLPLLTMAVTWTGVFGLMTAVPIGLAYVPVLWLWLRKRPSRLERGKAGWAAGALILSVPPTLLVCWSFGGGSLELWRFDWAYAFQVLPYVLLSVWGGFLLPRFLLSGLQGEALASDWRIQPA